jgi:hypothetical protein
MNLKYIYLPLFSVSLLLHLTSCDTAETQEGSLTLEERDNLTAESLTQLVVGDNIGYITSTNTTPIVGNLTFDTNLQATVGDLFYDYVKVGQYLFTITVSSEEDIYTTFPIALDNTLMDNGTNAQLGSRLRELLHREEAIFTPAELTEISDILSPSGSSSSLADDGVLISHLNGKYTQLVTSNRLKQARGTMAGTYYIEATSVEIDFRKPSPEEFTNYRFISSADWIPYITYRIRPLQKVERGTWTLELHNSAS